MNLREKIEMAKQLERLGVDVIEAGFASSSPGDFQSVQKIAETVKDCTVASLARAQVSDIDESWDAVKGAADPQIHLFIATSDLHMEYKLKMTRDEVLETTYEMTKRAAGYCPNIQFSAEDATRSDIDFLEKIVRTAVEAGATTINLPDTVGYTTPDEHEEFFREIRKRVPELDGVLLSSHCHNDLGLAVANTLAAIRGGVRHVECTVNGIGERAGNAALEEIAMALYVRQNQFGISTNINAAEIMRSSSLLSRITGVKVQPNKAIVGENAFAHEAGIHQHGVLAKKETYEIMTPESVGLKESNLVLGKHSGKHAFRDRLKDLGYTLSDEDIDKAFKRFKQLADRKKRVYDKDIEAIVAKEAVQVPKTFTLNTYVINSGNTITSTATISMNKDGKLTENVARGFGPVDAAFKAIDKNVGRRVTLEDYQVSAISEGEDAQGDARVVLKSEKGGTFLGRGLSTDVIEASIMAYINAINKMYHQEKES